MTVFPLQESRRKSKQPPTNPDFLPRAPAQPTPELEPAGGQLPKTAEQVFIEQVHRELDGYYAENRELHTKAPDEVFHWLSAVSARLVEIRAHLYRSNSNRFQAVRIREVDPFLEEVERQFKFHSRVAAMAELEWKMQGGAPA